MIVDTHLHVNTDDYKDDLDAVIARAKKAGVKKMIVIGMDEESSLKAIRIAEKHEGVYASVGLHPGYVKTGDSAFVHELVSHEKVVGIGETGLDFYWQDENRRIQIQSFIKHIEYAMDYDLPLIIHTRNSFQEAYDCLLPYKGRVRGVFHCFSSTAEDAKKAIELGFYIGVDGPITFKNPKLILDVVREIPLEYLLVETDSPYLTPMPYRGRRNEPQYLVEVVKHIARIKNVSVETVKQVTTQQAHHLFKLGGLDDEI